MSNIKERDLIILKNKSNFMEEARSYNKKKIIARSPKNCLSCKSENIEYWDETYTEIIFRCRKCKSYICISIDQNYSSIYFSY